MPFTHRPAAEMLPEFNTGCIRCPRLARHLGVVRSEYPEYHARPVPPFGDGRPSLLIVGLAPGLHGANRSGRPFTGDYAGILLYQTLYRFGYSSSPESVSIDDGLKLSSCRITNAVKCLPPQNKPLPVEVRQCNVFLRSELAQLEPGTAVLALGTVAHQAVLRGLGLRLAEHVFAHGAQHMLVGGLQLFDSYHCSRYNTNTRRLTAAMFEQVFVAIAAYLGRPLPRST